MNQGTPQAVEVAPRRRAASADPVGRLLAASEFVGHRTAQFWILQAIGWTGWGLTWVASGLYWGARPAYNLAIVAGMVTGMLLTGLLREIYRAIWDRELLTRVLVAGCASYVVAALWQVSKNVALFEFYSDASAQTYGFEHGLSYLRGVVTSWYIILGWSALYFGIKYYRMLVAERARALEAMATARDAQLRMLRYQLNPHFLFNTLNAISTLILAREGDQANRMVTRLSSFLRHSLDSDPMQKVDLDQEVRALRLYLDIEQVRFEERLRIEVDLQGAAGRGLVPSLILQPLVENAIKYAVARSEDGGCIRIRAAVEGDRLVMEVADDGPGLPEGFSLEGDARGVGLRNTRDRLRQVYGDAHELRLCAAHPHGLCVQLRIPFETREIAP
ncbi:MAG: histidine kinase [Pseudomonadales bacterium]|jgi:signal transduction histidine kinase|nr:histidine kinase [Pseudomonadales bacterium]